MSTWQVPHAQWLEWISADRNAALSAIGAPRDELDARLVQSLGRYAFPTGDDETVSREMPEPGQGSFESMTTLIRNSTDEVEEDDATRLRPDPTGLEVGLAAPSGGLEVSLVGANDLPTVVTERPVQVDPSVSAPTIEPPAAPPLAAPIVEAAATEPPAPATEPPMPIDGTVVAEAPPAPPNLDGGAGDGLFIPTLTRASAEPPPEEPPSPMPPAVTGDTVIGSMQAPPEPGSPHAVAGPPRAAAPPVAAASAGQPPAVSGHTVVGPPPEPPADLFTPEDDPSASKTSGVIMMDEAEAAQTLIRGEIPTEEPMGRPASKVVIDPSASGVMARVYDDDDDDEEEPTVIEQEPDELDAEDLVEEEAEVRPPVAEAGPPPAPATPPAPAPATPPPAPAESARPATPPPVPAAGIDAGPPPPPVSRHNLEAAAAAISSAPPTDEGWQIDAFGDHYGALLPVQRGAAAAAEADFLVQCMGLARGATMLDVGCGDGAHAVALAARGMAITGLDSSPAQLMRASQAAQAAGVSVSLVNGDMRQMPPGGPFDAMVCLGGTLGLYSDEDDRRALAQMRDRLAVGGRLMLHVLNRDYIVGRLPARSWWQGQGCLVLDEAQLYAPRSRVHVHRTVVFETGTQFEHNLSLRVYGLTELVYLCAQVGLRVLEYSGSCHTRGQFYGATSSEIWLVAQRAEA